MYIYIYICTYTYVYIYIYIWGMFHGHVWLPEGTFPSLMLNSQLHPQFCCSKLHVCLIPRSYLSHFEGSTPVFCGLMPRRYRYDHFGLAAERLSLAAPGCAPSRGVWNWAAGWWSGNASPPEPTSWHRQHGAPNASPIKTQKIGKRPTWFDIFTLDLANREFELGSKS